LIPSQKLLKPKAKGFGKISLAFYFLEVASNLIQGILPKFVFRDQTQFDASQSKLSYTAFDLRPHTGEICKTKDWPNDLLNLMKHALISDQPLLALSSLQDFPLNAALKD